MDSRIVKIRELKKEETKLFKEQQEQKAKIQSNEKVFEYQGKKLRQVQNEKARLEAELQREKEEERYRKSPEYKRKLKLEKAKAEDDFDSMFEVIGEEQQEEENRKRVQKQISNKSSAEELVEKEIALRKERVRSKIANKLIWNYYPLDKKKKMLDYIFKFAFKYAETNNYLDEEELNKKLDQAQIIINREQGI